MNRRTMATLLTLAENAERRRSAGFIVSAAQCDALAERLKASTPTGLAAPQPLAGISPVVTEHTGSGKAAKGGRR